MVVGDARQIDHMLAIAAAGDADVGFARFAGAVDDAAENRQRHRGPDVLERLFQLLHGANDVEALARTTGARDDADAAGAQAQRFQDFIADAHFLLGLGRQRYADRVADPGPPPIADAQTRFDRSAHPPATPRDAQVQGAVTPCGGW